MRAHIVFFAVVLVAILLNELWLGRYWYEHGPAYHPLYGANFSCRHAEWLGLDCRETYTAILDDLGVHHLRISAYWNEIEPRDDAFDFSSLDWQIAEARERGAKVVLTVGIKAQRYPEFYLPNWLERRVRIPTYNSPTFSVSPMWNGEIRAEAMEMLAAVVRRYRDEPTIEAWQVENEPLLRNRSKTHGWWIPPEILAREIALVRSLDPMDRPVVVNHSSWYRTGDTWRTALELGDVLGQSVYTKKHHYGPSWFYLRPYRLGPFTPDLPGQAREAERQGKELWLTELQAEPDEAQETLTLLKPDEIRSVSPRILWDNVRLANHSGASRVYLWGVEWWRYMAERWDEPQYWETGREIYRSQVTVAAEATPVAGPSSES